jgi:hypothetical protein
MRQHALEQALTRVFQNSFKLSREQKDALWSRFAARCSQEAAAWAAFATSMVLLNARLRPAIRACSWPGHFHRNW